MYDTKYKVHLILNSPKLTTHTSESCAKRSMPKFYFLDSISRNSGNESPNNPTPRGEG